MESARKLEEDRRIQDREKSTIHYLVSCVLRINQKELSAEVINYHYGGACLKIEKTKQWGIRPQLGEKIEMDFFLGKKCLKSSIACEVTWEELSETSTLGIKFLADERKVLRTAERAICHDTFSPSFSCSDPLDPMRKLFFQVVDVSLQGMLLSTSLTNKHLFPGMSLTQGKISVPGQESFDLDLFIENTRPSDLENMFYIGVSVNGDTKTFKSQMRSYLSIMAPALEGDDDQILHPSSELASKEIRAGLTFRTIIPGESIEYEKLLQLRYVANKMHGKVKQGSDWRDQKDEGKGDGIIICSYLKGQMVASMELRFGDENPDFRMTRYAKGLKISEVDLKNSVEINKLVVHPNLQGSDAVIGMFQKCHSILMAKGGRDVVICATDKLVKLYLRLGFLKLPYRIQHPSLSNVNLNIMLLKKETYTEGRYLNPGTWSYIYQATHEHLEAYGVCETNSRTKLKSFLGQKILRAKHVLKDWNSGSESEEEKDTRKKKQDEKRLKNIREAEFVDPKWTHQHMIASVIRPYLVCADELIGREQVRRILNEIGINRSYFESQSNWIGVEFLDEFLLKFGETGDVEELSKNAGSQSLSKEMIGFNYYVLKHFATPQAAFKAFVKIAPKFNLSRTYKVESLTENSAVLCVGQGPEKILPKNQASCLNWQASFNAYIQVMTNRDADIEKIACCYNGDDACKWNVKWKAVSNLKNRSIILGIYLCLSGFWTFSKGGSQPVSESLTQALLAGVFALLAYVTVLFHKEKSSRMHQFEEYETFQKESLDRYKELQKSKSISEQRYQESKLFQKTLDEILKTNEFSTILKVSLDSVCQKFEFDRAFVMLVDEKKEFLQTTMVAASEEGKNNINYKKLNQFSVNIKDKRKNQTLLSSVFHTLNPVLIHDAKAHLFQLNEASRKLVRELKTEGFVMVPIPSDSSCWGVIVADKYTNGKRVDKYDLKLLQRIGQHLGLALDKQADVDMEKNLRRSFEKYVPKNIVEQITNSIEPRLGGQLREITCMFLDIRDYTAMSQKLRPQVTIDLLNKVFSMVQEVVIQNNGLIDKFLGDGVLIIWGAVDQQNSAPIHAINCAQQILERLEDINVEMAQNGLPEINVGMGIDMGQAVCGNIGSHDRMEFTSIGSAVNIASRLEGLCKSKNARIIVSESVLKETDLEASKNWSFEEGVEIRGVDEAMAIGTHQ